ncbi:MAG TPA: GGDEF domain-containing protein [Candidatus Dormibacteraeota bacterium]|nr:GGDEF domain-containing protein [Candidatus Dormibacteraeota bacterium]
MSEPTRNETQLGIAELKKRLSAAGLIIVRQQENFRHGSTYFEVGDVESYTNIALSEEFLRDLPNTKEYQAMVDSYVRAVAGRLKCGSPELFYCESGVGVQVSFEWPIHSGGIQDGVYKAVLLTDVTNRVDGKIAKCSVEVGGGRMPAVLVQVVNDLRSAIDAGQIQFYEPSVHQERYQRVEMKERAPQPRLQPDAERFLSGKAYTLGFMAVDEGSEVWAVDPWDAEYIGTTTKNLSLAMRVLRENGLLQAGTSADYVRPTDKLLAEHSAKAKEKAPLSHPRQKLSHNSPPAKDELLKELQRILDQHPTFALIMLDVDNFKKVNDTNGHPAGDGCLDKFIGAVETVVGQRGRVYRWGGDEFAICLPDFSTAEAVATAERIRAAVEQAKTGGDIEVTTSVGVCGSDRTESKSPKELFDFADKAMYQSKHSGKNRVTAWPLSSTEPIETTPTRRLSEQERRKLADSVVLSIKTDNGQQRNYTIKIKNHSKELDVAIKRISLWSEDQRVGDPVFRPEGENARCWDVAACRELPINFDAGEVVAKRLWAIEGSPSMNGFHDYNLMKGHFRSKVRVEVLYEVLGIEKEYDETRKVQVDPINNTITAI